MDKLLLLAAYLLLIPAAFADLLPTPSGDIFYETKGEGCPVVFVGGGSAMSASQWDAARDLLADRFLTIQVDPPGVGASADPKAPYTNSGSLVAVLDHLELPAAWLVGSSFSGGLVLEAALEEPERVIGVVAVAPFLAGFEPSPDMAARMQRFGKASAAGGAAFVEVARNDPHFLPAPGRPAVRERAFALILEAFARPASDASFGQPPQPILDRLGEIVAPVLLTAGELDHPDITRRLDHLESEVRGARRVAIPQAGHTAAMENPEAFVEAVLPFLHDVGCRPSGE